MKFDKQHYEALKNLNPNNVEIYLKYHGWQKYAEYPDNSGSVWTKDTYNVRIIYDKDKYDDYVDNMHILIKTVAKTEGATPWQIISDINKGTVDKIKIHINEPFGKDGTIPLDIGIDKINRIKDLWLSVASSTESLLKKQTPELIYPPQKTENIITNSKNILLGQTEVGSYVIIIEMDVQPTDVSQVDLGGDIPISFARRVNLNMTRAISALDKSYKEALVHPEEAMIDIIKRTQRSGVNVNICEALGGLSAIVDEEYSDLDIDFAWAPSYPVPPDIPNTITIPAEQTKQYAQTAKIYRNEAPELNQEFAGRPLSLKNKKEEELGVVTIEALIHHKKSSLKIELPWSGEDSDYDKAIRAYRTRCMIKCVGDLKKEGLRGYRLLNPHDVEILSDESQDDSNPINRTLDEINEFYSNDE